MGIRMLYHDLTRRAFLKVMTAAGLAAPALTQRNGTLNHVTFGGSGMAATDIGFLTSDPRVRLHAIVDVDEVRSRAMREKFPKALYFRDWRELFAKEAGNFESCSVATPDHMHAAIAMTALRHGKHVYCQKPFCHTLFESRRLAEESAARPKLVTQLGVQRHSEPQHYRQAVRLIQSGTIGPVHTVYSWCTRERERAPQPDPSPSQADRVPPELDWDVWLGVAEERPYLAGHYHPGAWRSRPDFGEGLLGDFGPHVLDPVFTALELTAPRTIRSIGPPPTAHSWPIESEVIYDFPATRLTASRGLTVGWTDGKRRPPRQLMSDLAEGVELFPIGSAIVGTEGTMLLQHYGHPPRLFPEAKFRGLPLPDLPERGHRTEFINACFGLDRASAPFTYAGMLNEAVVAGTVAQRFPGERLAWDAAKLRFDNVKANDHIRRRYRKGWEIEGL
jgi:hypothetical protein